MIYDRNIWHIGFSRAFLGQAQIYAQWTSMKRCRSVLQRGCFRLFVFALKWSVRPRVMGILSNHPGWCCAQVGDALRCPASKFITHTLSNLTFLILLTAATFRLGDNIHPITTTEDLIWNRFDSLTYDEQVDSLLRNTFRPANILITDIQICIMVWILGQSLWSLYSHSKHASLVSNDY